MTPRTLHQYRFSQKNPFLGEERLLFMSQPGTPGQPGTADPNAAPQNAADQGRVNVDALGQGLDTEAKKRLEERKKLTDFMRELVPERAEILPDAHIEVREEWMELMGEYDGVQACINNMLEQRARFQNPKTLQNDPAFKKTYQNFYETIIGVGRLKNLLQGSNVDWGKLKEKAKDEAGQSTERILQDINAIIEALIKKRQNTWSAIEERIQKDFTRRIQNLKDIWGSKNGKTPPPGYESASKKWLAYLDDVEKRVKRFHLTDTDKAEHPEGQKHFKELVALWDSILDTESTVEMWGSRQTEGAKLSPPILEAKVKALEAKKSTVLTPALKAQYDQGVNEVVGPLRDIIGRLEHQHRYEKDHDAKEQLGAEIKELKKTLTGLENSRNLEKEFNEILSNPEPLMNLQRGGTTFSFPKGLKEQVEFLKTFPANATELNSMYVSMEEAIKEAERTLDNTTNYVNQKLPNLLAKVKLYQNKLNEKTPRERRQIIQVSGFKTYDVFKHTIESLFERSYKRDNDRKVGIVGRDALGFLKDVPGINKLDFTKPLSEIPNEFDTHREHAETEGFQHYEKVHEHASIEHIFHVMHDTDNEFEFRGVIGLLCKKGRMRWDDEGFYKQLNKFQKRIWVPETFARHYEDRVKSETMLKDAIFAIYGDPDIYRDWQSKNASSLSSEKKNKSGRFGELSEQRVGDKSALETLVDSILKKKISDHHNHIHFSDADPIEYEAVLDYAIEQGKLNNEDVLYYMIQGIAHDLIPLDRGSEMTGKNNNYPAIEFFAEATPTGEPRPTPAYIQELAEMTKEQYIVWYHNYVMFLPKVFQRLNKAQSQGIKMDHDYFTGTAAYLGWTSMEGLLKGTESGGYALQTTAAQNGTVGMVFGLDLLAEEYGNMGAKGENGLVRMVEMMSCFDATVSGRMHRKQNFLRLDYNAKNKEIPRYAEQYKDFFGRDKPPKTAGENLETIRTYFRMLDFDDNNRLLNDLFDDKINDDGQASAYAARMATKYHGIFGDTIPQTLDQLYGAIGSYVAYILKSDHRGRVADMLAKIRADHRAAGYSLDKLKAERDKKFAAFRAKRKKEIETGKKDDHHGHGDDHGHGGNHGEHPTEEGGHGDSHGASHGDDHGSAAATHGAAVQRSTHGGGGGHNNGH